jgi:hypothetical protein
VAVAHVVDGARGDADVRVAQRELAVGQVLDGRVPLERRPGLGDDVVGSTAAPATGRIPRVG